MNYIRLGDLDKGYESYLQITSQVDTIWANVKYAAYLKFNTKWVRRAIFSDTDEAAGKYTAYGAHKYTRERLDHLLSPHAKALHQAAVQKDGRIVTNYYLLRHIFFVLFPVWASLLIDRWKG